MSRARNVRGLRNVAIRLRARGHRVELHPGWEARGRDGLLLAGGVNHDTSDPGRLTWGRAKQILADGHGAISGNAICHWAIDRDGTVALIASGLAWHAGAGSWRGVSGNARFYGTEAVRSQADRLAAAQVAAARAIDEEMAAEFGLPFSMVCEHGEYATPKGRKRDRHGIDGAAYRASLGTLTAASLGEDWFDMATEEELRAVVREVVDERLAAREAGLVKRIVSGIMSHRRPGERDFASQVASGGNRLDDLPNPHENDRPVVLARIEGSLDRIARKLGIGADSDQ